MRITRTSIFLVVGGLLAACGRNAAPSPADADVLGSRESCAAYGGLPAAWGADRHAGMVKIAGGRFERGSLRGYAEERPLVDTAVADFWIDRTEVTNAQFARFVAATGYRTDAERGVTGASVFVQPGPSQGVTPNSWWKLVAGATWRNPEGPDGARPADNLPVVDVTLADARAYAKWLGRDLATEAQWEYAARAGRSNEEADRANRDAQGHPLANAWQGMFPYQDTATDGYPGRAPVGCFPANPFGLHDMVGNVWEWTGDAYRVRQDAPPSPRPVRVIKGGSFLCSTDFCTRARGSARQAQEEDLPASHLGFRTVLVE